LIDGDVPVRKLVVASSMSVYGEGKYICEDCGPVYPEIREASQLKENQWEPRCPACAHTLSPAPTDESKILMPSSIYAQSKRHQEEMCLLIGRTYGIPTIALRYFGVYGPGQSLSNPYTGVCAIFATRILNEKRPYVFEDGKQLRDFVNVADVADANLLALESNVSGKALNIGNGKPMSVEDMAWTLSKLFESRTKPYFSRQYRKGDVRHCFADITNARNILGYEPKITLERGLRNFVDWVKNHAEDSKDRSEMALGELRERQLVV
jgi:dTDP-L-rhamnose 4-epimerase